MLERVTQNCTAAALKQLAGEVCEAQTGGILENDPEAAVPIIRTSNSLREILCCGEDAGTKGAGLSTAHKQQGLKRVSLQFERFTVVKRNTLSRQQLGHLNRVVPGHPACNLKAKLWLYVVQDTMRKLRAGRCSWTPHVASACSQPSDTGGAELRLLGFRYPHCHLERSSDCEDEAQR